MKHFAVRVEKSKSSNYDARFVMSSTAEDRDKDTIDPAVYKAHIGKKLIALWQHKSDQPIGFWENLKLQGQDLVGDLKVASTNLGLMVKQLLEEEVPLGASIGFRGRGMPNNAGGIHFTELDLMECSVVSVPANARAIQIAKSFGVDLQSLEEDTSAKSGLTAAPAAIVNARKTIARVNLVRRKNARSS